MGRMSRDKGRRVEQALVNLHLRIGVHAERVPLSGASRYQGNGADIDVYAFGRDAAPLVSEVKARKDGEGFATLERWLGENDVLFLRRDRSEPLIVLPWRVWTRLLAALAGKAIPWPQGHGPALGCTIREIPAPASSAPPARLGAGVRAVVQDDGGPEVRLALFDGAERRGEAGLGAAGAVMLARDLLAAVQRLSRPSP
jgi:Holliday junction resolvase